MLIEGMSGSDLIEMYGESEYMDGRNWKRNHARKNTRVHKRGPCFHGEDESAELMGRSFFRRRLSAVKKVVTNPGRLAAYWAAPVTGGASLLALKSNRKAIGSAARFTQKKILRPSAGFVQKTIVRPTGKVLAPLVKPAAKMGLNYVTGGTSNAIFDSGIFNRAKKQLSKIIPDSAAPEAAEEGQAPAGGISKTVMIGAGLAVAAGLGLYLATRNKSGKSEK